MVIYNTIIWKAFVAIARALASLGKRIKRISYDASGTKKLEDRNLDWWKKQAVYLSTGSLIGHIDSLVARPNGECVRVVARGWLFHIERRIENISLRGFDENKSIIITSIFREDLKSNFPGKEHRASSGFMAASCIHTTEIDSVFSPLKFAATLDNGEVIEGSFSHIAISLWPKVPDSEKEPCIFSSSSGESAQQYSEMTVASAGSHDEALALCASCAQSKSDCGQESLLLLFSPGENAHESELLKEEMRSLGLVGQIQILSDLSLLKYIIARALPQLKRLRFTGSRSSATIKQIPDILLSFSISTELIAEESLLCENERLHD